MLAKFLKAYCLDILNLFKLTPDIDPLPKNCVSFTFNSLDMNSD